MDIYRWISLHVKAETALRALVMANIAADERAGRVHGPELLHAVDIVNKLSEGSLGVDVGLEAGYDSTTRGVLPDIDGQNLTD